MNVPQYLLGFQTSLLHVCLQPARGCALLIASKKLLDKREEGLVTSHLNNLGDSLTCLLQDCLNIPHLSWVRSMEMWLAMLQGAACDLVSKKTDCIQTNFGQQRGMTSHFTLEQLGYSLTCLLQDCLSIPPLSWVRSMERWLAMLQAFSATVSRVLGQTNAAGIGITSLGNSFVSSPYILATCTWLCHAACIQKTLGQERERTSHFTIWTTWVILSHVCFKTAWICLACLSIPRLSWVRSMERWLAMLQASSATVSHVLGQTNIAGIGIIRFQTSLSHIHLQHSATCLGTNQCCWVRNHTPVLHECSPVRACKGAAYDPVWNKISLIHSWLCHVCIHKTRGQERERTSQFTIWTTWVIL